MKSKVFHTATQRKVRSLYHNHILPWASRARTLHHTKIMAAVMEDQSFDAAGQEGGQEQEEGALCRWVYTGSHNFR